MVKGFYDGPDLFPSLLKIRAGKWLQQLENDFIEPASVQNSILTAPLHHTPPWEYLQCVASTSLPLRYSALIVSALVLCISLYTLSTSGKGLWWLIGASLLVLLGSGDLVQKHHAILRNYPIMGHFRFFFEFIRPEIRQYFIEGDTEAQPFSRAQRSLVYSAPRVRWTTARLAPSSM